MAINIYDYKHYKLFLLIPLALLFISLYFIPKIQLDSSLTGGVNVQLTTNSTQSIRNLSAAIGSVFLDTRVERSSLSGVTSLSVTIPTNSSLNAASQKLQEIFSIYSNYSRERLRVVSYQGVLLKEPNNITAKNGLAAASANETKWVALINSKLISEIADLKPLIANNTSYNASDAAGMQKLARNLYANASSIYEVHVINVLKGIVSFTTYSYNDVTPTLGSFFLTEVTNIIIVAFVLVAITVFVIFRTPVPAFAVVYGAANDIVIALGAMGAFHIPLGVVSVGGLLMLIGYSMDTDILSAIRVLRRSEGTAGERAMATFRTGITMTAAAMISFATLFAIAYITFIPEYIQISGVVLVGLVADIITTWFGNAVIIVWYKRRHEHAH